MALALCQSSVDSCTLGQPQYGLTSVIVLARVLASYCAPGVPCKPPPPPSPMPSSPLREHRLSFVQECQMRRTASSCRADELEHKFARPEHLAAARVHGCRRKGVAWRPDPGGGRWGGAGTGGVPPGTGMLSACRLLRRGMATSSTPLLPRQANTTRVAENACNILKPFKTFTNLYKPLKPLKPLERF